jgi:autotransporter-associated beta strand protein
VSAAGILDLNGFNQTLAELRRHTTHAATVTNTATTPAVLTIDGAVDHEFSGTIQDGSGGIRLVKRGPSSLTLSGASSYTGGTTVEAGTLILTTPLLADTSAVRITTGAVLDLPHGQTDTIAGLWIDGVQQAAGTYDANSGNFITGTGALLVTGGPPTTPYEDWLIAAGLVPGAPGTGPEENADGSGVPNLLQFALGGNPADAHDNGVHIAFDADDGVVGGPVLLTIAAPAGAVFSGTPSPAATIAGITITMMGSADLVDWDAAVEEVAPAFHANGAVTAPAGYQLHTFRLGAPPAAGSRGFLRVGVATP